MHPFIDLVKEWLPRWYCLQNARVDRSRSYGVVWELFWIVFDSAFRNPEVDFCQRSGTSLKLGLKQ